MEWMHEFEDDEGHVLIESSHLAKKLTLPQIWGILLGESFQR